MYEEIDSRDKAVSPCMVYMVDGGAVLIADNHAPQLVQQSQST